MTSAAIPHPHFEDTANAYQTVPSRTAYVGGLMRGAWGAGDDRVAAFVRFLELLSESEVRAVRTALEICPPTERTHADSDLR